MSTAATITIRITVETADGQIAEYKVTDIGSASAPPGEAEAIERAVRRLQGPMSRKFLRLACEAGLEGKSVTVDQNLVALFPGVNDGGSLGGAIAAAFKALLEATGSRRAPLDRISKYPSVWKVSEADARLIIDALDDSE